MKKTYTILFLIIFSKLSIFCLMFFSFSLLPFGARYYYPNFVYPPNSPISLQTAYKTWDAQHYLFLSEKGYIRGNDSNAFSPLFPFTMYLVTFLTRNSFVSGLILANIFSALALYLFYIIVKSISSEKTAYLSLVFLLIFPTSFYFSLIYTESLFFLLVMLFFFFLSKRNLVLASVVAFFLPLTRIIGVAIIVPFLFSYILEYHKHSLYDELLSIGKTLLSKKTFLLISPFLGFLATMGIMYITTGNYFEQFDALNKFVSHHSFFSLFNPLVFLRTFFQFPLSLHGYTNSVIDRIFFLLFVSFLPFLYKRVSSIFFIYAVVFGILPVLTGSFMSYTRYLVIVFPLFIAFAKLSQEKKYEQFTFPFMYVSILLQAIFLIMHSLNYWVA